MSVYYVVQVLGSIGANPEALQTDTSIGPWKGSCGLTSNNGPDLGRENCIIRNPKGDPSDGPSQGSNFGLQMIDRVFSW